MTVPILAAVLGVLIAVAAITIPRMIARGNHPEDHADSLGYLKDTGRSAADITDGNADRAFQQQGDNPSGQAGGSGNSAPPGGAGAPGTS